MHRVIVYLALIFSVLALVISVILFMQGRPDSSQAAGSTVSMLYVSAEDFSATPSNDDSDEPDSPDEPDEPEDTEDDTDSIDTPDTDEPDNTTGTPDAGEQDEPDNASADESESADQADDDLNGADDGEDADETEDTDEGEDDADESELEVEVEVEDEGIVIKVKRDGVESITIVAPGSSVELQKILSEVTGGVVTFEIRDGVPVIVVQYTDDLGIAQEKITPVGDGGMQFEILQADGSKIKVELSVGTGKELQPVKVTIEDGTDGEPVELEIEQEFSLTIDLASNQLVATTKSGAQVNLMTMPVGAFLRAIDDENLSGERLKLVAPSDAAQTPIVEASGKAKHKVFGLFPVEAATTIYLSAIDGAVEKIDQPIWVRLFGFLMTHPEAE